MAKKTTSTNPEPSGRTPDGKFADGNQLSVGIENGRPSLFKEEYIELAYKYTLLGATDEILAKYFNVSEKTIANWKNEFPDFLQSIKKGKEQADIEVVDSLFNKAKGFTKVVQKAFKLKQHINGEGSDERIELANEEVYIPPDTTAIIFWLKNRQPELWRDKIQNEVTGKDGKPIEIVPITGMVIK